MMTGSVTSKDHGCVRRAAMLLVLSVSSALGARVSHSQGPARGSDLLEVPVADERLLCRATSGSALIQARGAQAARVAHRFRFEVGEPGRGRTLLADYDSLGRPLTLTEVSYTALAADGSDIRSIVVGFLSDGTVKGVHVASKPERTRNSPGTKQGARMSLPPLSDLEERKAMGLAKFLWDHRCGRARPRASR